MQAQASKVLFFSWLRLHITTTCLNDDDDDAKEDDDNDGDDDDDEKEYDSDCSSPPHAFELEVFCKTRAPINCLRSTWIITVFVSFVIVYCIVYCVFVSFAIVFVCKSGNYLSSVNQVVLFKARPDCEIVGLPSFTPPSRLVCRRARFSDAKHQSSN